MILWIIFIALVVAVILSIILKVYVNKRLKSIDGIVGTAKMKDLKKRGDDRGDREE